MLSSVDIEKILLGAMPVLAAILTAFWTLRGKASDNISSDQAAFRKDLMERIKSKEADAAALQLRVIVLELENASLKRDIEELQEESMALRQATAIIVR